MEQQLSKYAAKKKRQLETGEVGYITEPAGEVMAEAAARPRLTPEEQSRRDKARAAAEKAEERGAENAVTVECLAAALDALSRIAELSESANGYIQRMKAYAKGSFKNDVLSLEGLAVSASMKFGSAFARANAMMKEAWK